jgi:adenylosuccinate lyase
MIALSAHVGRDQAHELLYRAVRRSREADEPLRTALRASLDPEVWTALESRLPTPSQYVGVTSAVCAAALSDWAAARTGQGGSAAAAGAPMA